MSIYNSLKHRKTALSDATGLTDTVISRLYPLMHNAIIDRFQIVEAVAVTLQSFDKPAAVYYKAFHLIDS